MVKGAFNNRNTLGFMLLFFLFSIMSAKAINFGVNPIRVYISPNKNTAVIEINNFTKNKMFIETEIYKWDIDNNGKFILQETEDVVVVPPYIELEGKGKQLVKVAFLGEFDRYKQKSYRLILKQIPQEIDIEESPDEVKAGIQVVLHISIPVFVNPIEKKLFYNLSIEPVDVSEERVILSVANTGNAFAKITKVILYHSEEEIFSKDTFQYILPDRKINFLIENRKGKKVQKFRKIPDRVKIILDDEKEITVNL